ncbi:OmpA family protein [Pseudomonadota bacterium]
MAVFLTSHNRNKDSKPGHLLYPPFKQVGLNITAAYKKLTLIGQAEEKKEDPAPSLSNDNSMREPRLMPQVGSIALSSRHLPRKSETHEENSWMQAYIDVITLLLTMFVVMMALSEPPGTGTGAAERIANLSDSFIKFDTSPILPGTPKQTLRDSLAPILEKWNKEDGLKDVSVNYKENAVELRLSSKVLFPSAGAKFSAQGVKAIASVAKLLRNNDFIVTVEGHSDNIPMASQRFASNWELSSSRASTVVRQLIEEGVPASRLRAIGYADTKPIADNSTAEGRSTNRRVVFVLEQSQ